MRARAHARKHHPLPFVPCAAIRSNPTPPASEQSGLELDAGAPANATVDPDTSDP